MPVRMHKFREDARKQHRELAQQNSDMLKITSQVSQSVMNFDRFEIPLNSEDTGNKNNISGQTNR